MKMSLRLMAPLAVASLFLGAALPAAHADDSYNVDVAFDALFDTDGKVTELRPHDEAAQAPALWNNLKSRLGGMKLPPVKTEDGQPATFRTGLYVTLEVARGGGKGAEVRIKGLDARPLVLSKDYWSLPATVSRGEWTSDVPAECVVGTDGRCGEVKVKALAGMPKWLTQWASSSLALWRFQPPEINGKPIAAPVREVLSLTVTDNMPVDFRNQTQAPSMPRVVKP